MKNLLLYALILISVTSLLTACLPKANEPPEMPHSPNPEDGASDVKLTPVLSWSATDPDGDPLKYDVYFGTTPDPMLVATDVSESEYRPGVLKHGTRYYWRVVAKDGNGGVATGTVWSFTTIEAEEEWRREWELGTTSKLFSVRQTPDGGYVVVGGMNSSEIPGYHRYLDFWIVRLDRDGSTMWLKALGGSWSEEARSVELDPDGGYVIAGYTFSGDGDVPGNHGNRDFWIVKLNSGGYIVEWSVNLGGSNIDHPMSIRRALDGGYVAVGYTYSSDGDVSGMHGFSDFWVVRFSGEGDVLWKKCLGGGHADEGFSVDRTSDGGYVVAGYTYSNDGDVSGNHGLSDMWVVKLKRNGDIEWERSIGGSGRDEAFSIQQTSDGGYVVVGYTRSDDFDAYGSGYHGSADVWVVKLDSDGKIEWQRAFGGFEEDVAYSVHQTFDGGYILAGYTYSNDGDVSELHSGKDSWLFKIDSEGNLEWDMVLDFSGDNQIESVRQTEDGGFVISGRVGRYRSKKAFIVKIR